MTKTTVEPRSIREEIQQSKPFRSKCQEAYLALLRTSDDAKRSMSSILDASGITLQQYNVLRILRGAGKSGLPTLSIGDRMIERTPGVTRLIDRMEKQGWVARERCKTDRRRVWCRITDEGLDLLAQLDDPVDAVDDHTFACFDESEIDTFIEYMGRLRAHLADDQD